VPSTPDSDRFAKELWAKIPRQTGGSASKLKTETQKALEIRKKNESFDLVSFEDDQPKSKIKQEPALAEKTGEDADKKRRQLRKKYMLDVVPSANNLQDCLCVG
jgi:hypothetical protein